MSRGDTKTPGRRGRLVLGLAIAAVVLGLAHYGVIQGVRRYIHDTGLVVAESSRRAYLEEMARRQHARREASRHDERWQSFREVDVFDEDAMDWSNQFSQYAAGLVVFDANGDGRQDVYFCQDGQSWTRPTDARGVLMGEPRHQHNALYLNLGNDPDGRPRYAQVSELARANDTFVDQELLVESYLFPRQSAGDDPQRPARQSAVAVAADFDADGRPDLLVGNLLPGMIFSHDKTQGVMGQFVSPTGRRAKYDNQTAPAQGAHLIRYTPDHNLDDLRQTARGLEPVAANSLYLNLGDADGDGLPEWRDASVEAGIRGFHNTISLAVADVDLDGDLDVFAASAMDGDYFPAGSGGWAGGANELFVNQLAETGTLRFEERAAEMDADGVYDDDFPMPDYWKLRRIPWLPEEYSFLFLKYVPFKPPYLVINGEEGEHGQISWASLFQDVDLDGYPDVWVANDFGFLRLYRNDGGKRFVHTEHVAVHTSGNWMALAAADFDGDLDEDLFAGNLGGSIFTNGTTGSNPFGLFEPVLQGATLSSMFVNGKHDTRHVVIDGGDVGRRLETRVRHSTVLPPDASFPDNFRGVRVDPNGLAFDHDSLDPYEFAWGASVADVDNDGRTDLYYHGTLNGRGGGLANISGTGPGRLLINASDGGDLARFVDATAEHHLFNILDLSYDRLETEGYVYRRAPAQNWHKRDVVYSYDRSAWTFQGPRLQKHISNSDLIQTVESGKGAIFADLNGDAYPDLLLRNGGGYDSRSPKAGNLKWQAADGRTVVLPPHSYHYPSPTNYEPGATRVFLNPYRQGGWIRVRLVDLSEGSYNRDAVGARLVLDDRQLYVHRIGDGSFLSNRTQDPIFGLGERRAQTLVIHWPDRERTVTRHQLGGLARGTLVVERRGAAADTQWLPQPQEDET